MIKYFRRKSANADDGKLRDILKQYDPAAQMSGASFSELEASIMGQLDALQETPSHPVTDNTWLFPSVLQQEWNMRTVVFSSMLIVLSGFLVGQILYGTEMVTAPTGAASLIAFADEASGQYLTATDTSWGDTDDNAE